MFTSSISLMYLPLCMLAYLNPMTLYHKQRMGSMLSYMLPRRLNTTLLTVGDTEGPPVKQQEINESLYFFSLAVK